MSKFTPVPSENAVDVWPLVEPVLELAVRRNGGFTTQDILTAVTGCTMQLWLSITDKNEVEAVGITKIETYPQKKTCLLLFVAGKDYNHWKGYMKNIEGWAKRIGCTEVEFIGRKGWAKIMDDFEQVSTIYRKQL